MPKVKEKKLWKSKTFWFSIAGILTAIGSYIAGEVSIDQVIQAVLVFLSLIGLRLGINKPIK